MNAAPPRLAASATIRVDIAAGELIDKISILEIKADRIRCESKRANVVHELTVLRAARDGVVPADTRLARLAAELKAVNTTLWEVEDDIRECERNRDFGPRFVELARLVYRTNDRRAALKREVNEHLGSTIVEEKSYAAYA